MGSVTTATTTNRVLDRRDLTDDTFVLRFERGGLEFEPGQYISVGLPGKIDMREYSVYSGAEEQFLEILVKRIPSGAVSPALAGLQVGDQVVVDGPFGFFTIDEADQKRRYLFVATGTGISPFHCFLRSYANLDFTLLHGVRHLGQRYAHDEFPRDRLTSCVTGEAGGDFAGRVTDYLRANAVASETNCYLCGNCDMIYEAFDILTRSGVPAEQLFAEVYF